MRIVVFGAGGRIGRKLVSGGMARGHEVTAAVRQPEDVRAPVRIPRIVTCDLTDGAQVDAAVAGHDVAVVAVRSRSWLFPGDVHSQGTGNVIAGMRTHGVGRLVCVSAMGTGDDHDPNLPPLYTRVTRPLLLSRAYEELRVMEALVRASGLEWTLVHVAQLTDDEALGRYRAEEGDSLPEAPTIRISRADVADFILKELERREWVGRDVALAY